MSQEKVSGFAEMKGEVQEELSLLEKHLDEMDTLRAESINKIELRKSELKRLSKIEQVREEHLKLLEELRMTKDDIDKRRLSMDFMDETISNLDDQVSAIQAEHDRIAGEIELKKKRLQDKIQFYEELNAQIEKLVELLRNEEQLFKAKLDDLENQKEGLKNNPDLSPELLEQALRDLDKSIEKLKTEHEAVKNTLASKLSTEMEPALMKEVLAEIDRKMQYHKSHAKVEIEPGLLEHALEHDHEHGYEHGYKHAKQERPEVKQEDYKHELKGHMSEEPIYPKRLVSRSKDVIVIQNEDALKAVLGSKGLKLTKSNKILTRSGNAISLQEAIAQGLIDMEVVKEMGLSITSSNKIVNKDGGYVTLEDALEMGLMKLDLPLKGLKKTDDNMIITPDGKKMTIHDAMQKGLLSTEDAVEMGFIDEYELEDMGLHKTESNRILNQEGKPVSPKSAYSMGLMNKALTLTESKRIVTPDGKTLSIQEAISKGLLDVDTATKLGLMDKAMLAFRGLTLTKSGRVLDEEGKPITMEEALEMGLMRKDLPKNLIYTTSARLLTMDGRPITVKDAIKKNLLDISEAIAIDLVDKRALNNKGYTIEGNQIEDQDGRPISIEQAVQLGLLKRVRYSGESVKMPTLDEEKIMDVITYQPEEETPRPEETSYPSHFTTEKSKTDKSSPIRTEYPSMVEPPLMAGEDKFAEEQEQEQEATPEVKEIKEEEKGLFYGSFVSQISSLTTEGSEPSVLGDADINYLKNEFGKALSLGLAELVQVQPYDPIHYLAHWLFKYRFNQEIEILKQKDLEGLLAERNRLAKEKAHEEIIIAAQEAVFDAWLRAENIIVGKELMLMHEQDEEEENSEEQDFTQFNQDIIY